MPSTVRDHGVQESWLDFLTSDPLADVRRAVAQGDAVAFRRTQEPNDVAIDEYDVLEIQHQALTRRFRGDQRRQFADVVRLESTTDGQDDVTIHRAPDFQHWSSASTKGKREASENAESIEVGACFDWSEFHQLLVSGTAGRTCYCFVRLARKRFLSIPSARIFVSSVDRAMPSRVAAPVGPYTRPPLARRASSIMARSWRASVLGKARLSLAGAVASQLCSTGD